MKKAEPKLTAKLPIKMTEGMYNDLENIGDEMGDRSKTWVARKFIADGIALWKKQKRKKR